MIDKEYLQNKLKYIESQKEQVKIVFNKLCGMEELVLEMLTEQNKQDGVDGIAQGN